MSLRKDSLKSNKYVIQKLLFLDNKYQNVLENSFNDSNNYFQLDGFLLNKMVKGPRYDLKNKPISYSYVGYPEIFEKRLNFKLSLRDSHTNFKHISYPRDHQNSSLHKNSDHKANLISVEDDDNLNRMYDKFQRRVNSNNINDFYNELPYNIKSDMKSQEKLLKKYDKHLDEVNQISNRIKSKVKTNKKLLIEESDIYIPEYTEGNSKKKDSYSGSSTLKISGLNLLHSEYERMKSTKGKKILYIEEKQPNSPKDIICLRYESAKTGKDNNNSLLKSFDSNTFIDSSHYFKTKIN